MTTKQKFEVENPPVIVLRNKRYAYRVECPWIPSERFVLDLMHRDTYFACLHM